MRKKYFIYESKYKCKQNNILYAIPPPPIFVLCPLPHRKSKRARLGIRCVKLQSSTPQQNSKLRQIPRSATPLLRLRPRPLWNRCVKIKEIVWRGGIFFFFFGKTRSSIVVIEIDNFRC